MLILFPAGVFQLSCYTDRAVKCSSKTFDFLWSSPIGLVTYFSRKEPNFLKDKYALAFYLALAASNISTRKEAETKNIVLPPVLCDDFFISNYGN